jgi:hypothetical protein
MVAETTSPAAVVWQQKSPSHLLDTSVPVP